MAVSFVSLETHDTVCGHREFVSCGCDPLDLAVACRKCGTRVDLNTVLSGPAPEEKFNAIH